MPRWSRTEPTLAMSGLVVALASWGFGVTLMLSNFADAQREDFGTPAGDLLLATAALSFAFVGYLLRRSGASVLIGWLLLATGIAAQVFGAADEYEQVSKQSSARAATIAAAVSSGAGVLVLALLLVAIPLLFPDGRLASPRWWPVIWVSLAVTGVALVVPAAAKCFAALGVAALASLGGRYHRADAVVRAQLRWLFVSAAFTLASLVAVAVVGHWLPRPTPEWFRACADVSNVLIAATPISIGLAVARYRLWAIDVIAHRAVVLLAVGVFTACVYVALVVGVGAAVGDQGNVWLLVLATVALAVAIDPLRRRVEVGARRLVYGHRTDPYEVLTDFSRRVAASYVGTDALLSCARAAAIGTGSTQAHAWVRAAGTWRHIAQWPTEEHSSEITAPCYEEQTSVSVGHGGVVLGAVSVPAATPLTAADRSLLRDLAAQSAMLFRNVALSAELQHRLEELSHQAGELRESRARILVAEDSARQRIERDLHDGAQQRLVTLGMSLQRLRVAIPAQPATIAMLDVASADLRLALSDLRDLARGIYPALLAETGLADAVATLVERSSALAHLSVAPRRRYPRPIETTAYFVVAEALTNIAKHAPAATASVEIIEQAQWLTIRVCDDGPGNVDENAGSGLRGLRDRVASAGGIIEVHGGTGTTIEARLPCG